jgi:hypothetical protein
MSAIPNRMIIYVKDVMNLTGKGERTARNLLTSIRKHYGKGKGGMVTVEEFCDYTGFDPDHVIKFLH